MIETALSHYRITAKLGQGGRGAVFRATDTKLDREVAIKVLAEAFAQDTGRLARFDREAPAKEGWLSHLTRKPKTHFFPLPPHESFFPLLKAFSSVRSNHVSSRII